MRASVRPITFPAIAYVADILNTVASACLDRPRVANPIGSLAIGPLAARLISPCATRLIGAMQSAAAGQ